jgi:hypothetical protein
MIKALPLLLLLFSFTSFAIEKPPEAIEAEGLSLKRYNLVVALAGSYQNINAKVTEFAIEEQSKETPTS